MACGLIGPLQLDDNQVAELVPGQNVNEALRADIVRQLVIDLDESKTGFKNVQRRTEMIANVAFFGHRFPLWFRVRDYPIIGRCRRALFGLLRVWCLQRLEVLQHVVHGGVLVEQLRVVLANHFQVFVAEQLPNDTERKNSASFGREDGASRRIRGRTWALARTTDGLDARSFFALSNFKPQDVT